MKLQLKELETNVTASLDLLNKINSELKKHEGTKLRRKMFSDAVDDLENLKSAISLTLDLNSRTVEGVCIDTSLNEVTNEKN